MLFSPFSIKLRYDRSSEHGRRALSPLAGGHYGVLWGILGDLDYMNKALDLPRSTLAAGPCALCRCKGFGPLSWTDFRTGAPWRNVQWTAHEWRLWEGRSKCPLFTDPNFSPWLLSMDWMHAKYLGHDQQTYGSVLSLMVHFVLPGQPEKNLETIWKDIQEYYREFQTPVRYKYLNRLSMFQRKTYPKLRGKAAEIKYLAGPLLHVWQKYYNPQLSIHRDILLYLKLNLQIEEQLVDNKDNTSFPEEEAARFEGSVTSMLLLLTRIAEHFLDENLFNITQKAHFIQHVALLAGYINPRLLWCFMGEDMQKRMATLAKSCVRGQRPGQTIFKLFVRYRLALHLRFQKH